MTTDSYKVVHRSVKNGNETKRYFDTKAFQCWEDKSKS